MTKCQSFKSIRVIIPAFLLVISFADPLWAEEKVAREALALSPSVHLDNFTFTPAVITIAPGTTVTWIQWRRHPSYRRRQQQSIPLQGHGYRAAILLHLQGAGDV